MYYAIDKTFKANNFAMIIFVETVSVGTDKRKVLTWMIIVQYCDTDIVCLCQYSIFSCHQSLNLSACELSMFKLYLNVSLV